MAGLGLNSKYDPNLKQWVEVPFSTNTNSSLLPTTPMEIPAAQRAVEQANQILNETPDYLKKDLSKSNPLPWQRYVDPSASDLANEQLGRVYNKTPGYFDYNPDGTRKDNSLGRIPDYYKQTFEKGVNFSGGQKAPTGNAMLDAINNKYEKQYANKYAGLSTQNQMDRTKWQSRQLARTSNILGNIQQNEMQNFREQFAFQQQRQQMYNQWKNAKQQAVGGFLGNLLQIGAAVGGFLIGGPPGAAAGAGLAGAFDSNNVGNIA